MLTETLQIIFNRDLTKLKTEIGLYKDESAIWKLYGQLANTAGNLCLHLVGNLNHYIGAILGNTGYLRNRDLEFSDKNVPRDRLIHQVESTIPIVSSVLTGLTPEDLNKEFPEPVFDHAVSTEFMLVHLATHLTYHLGQINYHRRMLDKG